MNKKGKIMLFVFFLCILCPIFANAAELGKYVEIAELDILVRMPLESVVLTRDMPDDTPSLLTMGVTGADVTALMESDDCYLQALFPSDVTRFIQVFASESIFRDYDEYQEYEISMLQDWIEERFESDDALYEAYGVYTNKYGHQFAVSYSEMLARDYFVLSYETVIDGQSIRVELSAVGSQISLEDQIILQNIVNDIVLPEDVPHFNNQSLVYKDAESGIEFTLPVGWDIRNLSSRAYTDYTNPDYTLFAPVGIDYQNIKYTSTDMWRALSPAERTQLEELGYNRAALNSSKFATEDIAIDFGVFSGDIQRKFIGDNEFFLFTTEEPFQWNGISTNAKVYAAICIRNGYYFAFIYTDVLYSDAAYKEFLSILESITVPSVARVQFVSQSGALTMKLPEGWVIKVKNDLLDYAEFTPKIVTGDPAIVLITMDSWADLNETTRSMYELLGYDRTVIDNRFNDQAFVAKMLNQEEHSLSLWEGSNKSFYLYDGQVEVVINGETKMIRSPCAATFQDGYFFVFQLYDASCSKENQADFLALLDSVKKHNSK